MSIKQKLIPPYFRIRNSWPVWYGILNKEGRKLFKQNPPELSPLQQEVLHKLQTQGIATTSLDALYPEKNALQELQQFAEQFKDSAESKTKKTFLKHYWDTDMILDATNPYVRIALDPLIVDVVNSYMNMFTRLQYISLLETVPRPNEDAIMSQRWHRDPEEKKMCKVFIYINDVDKGTGPFFYIPNSAYGQKYGHLFPQKPPAGSYPEDGQVEAIIPPEEIKMMTGKAGTVLFCDTIGLHKGGFSTESSRLMYTAFYASKTFSQPIKYQYPADKQAFMNSLPKQIRYAIDT